MAEDKKERLLRLAITISLDIRCPEKESFMHVLPGTNCHQYYVCSGPNSVERHVCPTGTHFSSEFKACKVGGHCYDIVCTGRVDGRYTDTTENCSRWYKCHGGAVMWLESCLPGHQFSEARNECIPAEMNHCSQPKTTAGLIGRTTDPCKAQDDGLLAVRDSHVYVRCHNHQEMENYSCPPGQRFDGRSCRDHDCSAKPDGYHALEDTNCHEYVLCKNGKIIQQSKCPGATAFDGMSCVPQRIAACPQKNKCSNLPDGVYPHTNSHCRSYYLCKEGRLAKEDTCHQGSIWNGHACVPEHDFTCTETTSSAECSGKNGYIIDIYSGCKKYHFCNRGIKMSYLCPHGQLFNGYRCVWPGEYECPEQNNRSCEGLAPGYYIDPESNCRSYFYCTTSSKITYVCPVNEVFNGVECVPKEGFKCPHVNVECVERPDGYQRKGRSVHEYIYCSEGVKLTTLQCDHNKVYNGERCVDVSQLRNLCHNVHYGYLTDKTCTVYYVCRDEKPVSYGICPNELSFDGKSCVQSSSGKCDRGSLHSCAGAPNGFYQDFNSDCRKYFYCINGEKTALSCPAGQIHNGDICVPSHRFTCPSSKISEILDQ